MKEVALQYTYDDYRLLPQTGPRHQLIDGDLVVTPSPTSRHQIVLQNLFRIVDPGASTLRLYRLRERPTEPLRIYRAGESLESPTFPGLHIALDEVFAP